MSQRLLIRKIEYRKAMVYNFKSEKFILYLFNLQK